MSKVVINHIIEHILSFWLLVFWRLGRCFVRLAGVAEVVLHYTISKLSDSAEAHRLLSWFSSGGHREKRSSGVCVVEGCRESRTTARDSLQKQIKAWRSLS